MSFVLFCFKTSSFPVTHLPNKLQWHLFEKYLYVGSNFFKDITSVQYLYFKYSFTEILTKSKFYFHVLIFSASL